MLLRFDQPTQVWGSSPILDLSHCTSLAVGSIRSGGRREMLFPLQKRPKAPRQDIGVLLRLPSNTEKRHLPKSAS